MKWNGKEYKNETIIQANVLTKNCLFRYPFVLSFNFFDNKDTSINA